MSITDYRPSMEMMAHFVVTPSVRTLAETPGFKDMPLGVVPDLISDRAPTLNRLESLEAQAKKAKDYERVRKLGNALIVIRQTDKVLYDPEADFKNWHPSHALQPLLHEKLSESKAYNRLMIENHQSPPPVGTTTKLQAVRYIAGLQIVSDQIVSTSFGHRR